VTIDGLIVGANEKVTKDMADNDFNRKRKIAGEDIIVYRKKKRKTNAKRKMKIGSPKHTGTTKVNSVKVCMKHLLLTNVKYKPKQLPSPTVKSMNAKIVPPPKYEGTKVNSVEGCTKHLPVASGEYKPKELTSSTVESNGSATKKRKEKHFLACMEHSVTASATYKPKRCIGLVKRFKARQTTTKSTRNRNTKKERTAQNVSYLCDLGQGKKRSKIMFPTRKRKFEKNFPPINKLIDMDGIEKNCV